MTGGLSLQSFDASRADPGLLATMVAKLRAGEMPPKDKPRPDGDTLEAFIAALRASAPLQAGASRPVETVAFPHNDDVMSVADQNALVHSICAKCHTDDRKPGGLSFEHLDIAAAPPAVAEDMIAKLRAGMMPPVNAARRPDEASIHAFVVSLERRLDAEARLHPDAGSRVFQRLNRTEYANSVRAMLGIDVDVSQWLPPDTISHNFDNIASVQTFSPTLLQAYLDAADAISRLAVGDADAVGGSITYATDPTASQTDYVPGAPFGTRGGISVEHVFPADGTYRFRLHFFGTPDGNLFGMTAGPVPIELSVDGQRAALLTIDPQLSESDRQGLTMTTAPIEVATGPHRVSAAFPREGDGPVDDLFEPHRYTLADTNMGDGAGITTVPHLRELTITGPLRVTGVSDTVSRRRIFTCRPMSADGEAPCATKIVARLANQAFRRPATEREVDVLMHFYDLGRAHGGFEAGIRAALQGLLASPKFLFRFEPQPASVRPGDDYRIDDVALASRLSYFLWATPPDRTLRQLALAGRLHQPAVLHAQVRRMLKDPRSLALSTRFAAQWLRLQDVDKVRPDALAYPQYDATLADAMKRETELFFDSIVHDDRSVLDLLTGNDTFVNEALARHYGIAGVAGPAFRKVSLEGTGRRGLLGQGSILVETSVANRTDPVLRGKWVLEVLLGQPPPPPPPNVPPLEDTGAVTTSGRPLSVRQRMEEHRKSPFCASCHRVIDPIGLALENFDPTGHWRVNDNGVSVDASTTLYDGTKMVGLPGLEQALLKHQDTFLRVFTENLMAYALGRRVRPRDMPAVRAIVDRAAGDGDRFSSFVNGIVESAAFRMSRADTLSAGAARLPARTRKGF